MSRMPLVDLGVYPDNDDTTDIQFQTCQLPLEVMLELGVTVGSHLEILYRSVACVCSVWPLEKCFANCVRYDKSVYRKYGNTDVLKPNTNDECGTDYRATDNKIKCLKTGKAIKVNITVIVEDIAKVKTFRKHVDNSQSVHKMCTDCLLRTCVADRFTVELKHSKVARLCGISCVVINKCEGKTTSKYDAFVIHTDTEIVIDSVHSREWFEQVTGEKGAVKVGGLAFEMNILTDLIRLPLLKHDQFRKLGLDPPQGVLLCGLPGCGKTTIVRHAVTLCDAFLVSINGPEIFGPHPGETELNLRNAFDKACLMSEEGPCVLFVDEIDSICPRKGRSGGVQEARVTSQFLTLLDGLTCDQRILVICATNRPNALDPALRRPGRLDREIMLNVPTRQQRRDILALHTSDLPICDIDLDLLADMTNGYVGADLEALCHEAAYSAMSQMEGSTGEGPVTKVRLSTVLHHVGADLEALCHEAAYSAMSQMEGSTGEGPVTKVTQDHFISAVKRICPSMHKGAEGIVDFRPVLWSDIGGLDDVKIQIKQAVEWPLRHPEAFRRMGLPCPKGVLLYGPPGCCKTTLVRAAATATNTTFLAISGAQLYSPYVGDSERLISEVFQRARTMAPSIIFLDEIDSIVGKRSESSQRGVQERVLSTLLNEMDGIGSRLDDQIGASGNQKLLEGEHVTQGTTAGVAIENRNVLVVAATNRPDLLDEALVRPGRIDRMVYVPPPDVKARREILNVFTKRMSLLHVDLDLLAQKTHMFTGADLENLCREAALCALTEELSATAVTTDHFTAALINVKPSLTIQLINQYSSLTMSTFTPTQS